MTTLATNFTCLSPESATPDTIPMRHRIEELTREVEYRRRSYPGRVRRARMTQQEADFQILGLQLVLEDCRLQAALDLWHPRDDPDRWAEVQHLRDLVMSQMEGVTWSAIVSLLHREIAMRRRYYPEWTAAGSMTASDARHRLERIEAVHFDWWRWARHFMPDGMTQRRLAVAGPGSDMRAAFLSAHRTHRDLFDPAGKRGEYTAGTPASLPTPEPELAFG